MTGSAAACGGEIFVPLSKVVLRTCLASVSKVLFGDLGRRYGSEFLGIICSGHFHCTLKKGESMYWKINKKYQYNLRYSVCCFLSVSCLSYSIALQYLHYQYSVSLREVVNIIICIYAALLTIAVEDSRLASDYNILCLQLHRILSIGSVTSLSVGCYVGRSVCLVIISL